MIGSAADLTRDHPAIQIEDTPQFYDISVFNRCAETGNVLFDPWIAGKTYTRPLSASR